MKSRWGRRWLQAAQALGWVERISRGKEYARGGHVLRHSVVPGRISAQVQGSRFPPYEVRFAVEVVDERGWRQALDELKRRPLFVARLLADEVPLEVEPVLAEAGVALLPAQGVEASCTCPSEGGPCKHLAAVSYVVAEALEDDPFLLFAWRGRTRAQIVADLRSEARARVSQPTEPDRFWGRRPFPEVRVEVSPPAAPQALLRRLGGPSGVDRAFVSTLAAAYEAIAAQAARVQ
jgi:uncharacterized Zn finger protein